MVSTGWVDASDIQWITAGISIRVLPWQHTCLWNFHRNCHPTDESSHRAHVKSLVVVVSVFDTKVSGIFSLILYAYMYSIFSHIQMIGATPHCHIAWRGNCHHHSRQQFPWLRQTKAGGGRGLRIHHFHRLPNCFLYLMVTTVIRMVDDHCQQSWKPW